ncbi:unnamed protein product [Vitrella brassicaformis CCMP3155]|uniref:Kinetochore protein SPC25 n=1 Tax=Vitrella brassicaformis (strain CCMP3155) TaxID=1169540 RepID=A0A0G4FK23_VITBC|nr:unnamed protein product [Vitrella brassicaformis CCMP3155]|eukprot:CEM13904.1 unnamed protein product [Vitrella brassicaformis CCMP3155]
MAPQDGAFIRQLLASQQQLKDALQEEVEVAQKVRDQCLKIAEVGKQRCQDSKTTKQGVLGEIQKEVFAYRTKLQEYQAKEGLFQQKEADFQQQLSDVLSKLERLPEDVRNAETETGHMKAKVERAKKVYEREKAKMVERHAEYEVLISSFQRKLGLKLSRVADSVGKGHVRVIFTNLHPADDAKEYAFELYLKDDETEYKVLLCDPPIADLPALVTALNAKQIEFGAFVCIIRTRFKAIASTQPHELQQPEATEEQEQEQEKTPEQESPPAAAAAAGGGGGAAMNLPRFRIPENGDESPPMHQGGLLSRLTGGLLGRRSTAAAKRGDGEGDDSV